MIPRETLAALSIFRNVGAEVVDALASRAVDVRFPAEAVIFQSGSQPRGWFVVIEGAVRVVRAEGGRQHVIHTEGPGGTLGEVPLFTEETHPATAIASEPTRCALFDKASLESAMREQPEIGFLLARRLALRVQTLVERLNNRSVRSVRSRLIDYMLERHAIASRPTISMGMTQRKVAEELGTVREVVSRELQSLAREGLIAPRGGGRYEIRDAEALRSLSTRQ
jgi:CRP/FNR family transcriptional regulator